MSDALLPREVISQAISQATERGQWEYEGPLP